MNILISSMKIKLRSVEILFNTILLVATFTCFPILEYSRITYFCKLYVRVLLTVPASPDSQFIISPAITFILMTYIWPATHYCRHIRSFHSKSL
jgi:hypothetical protein